MSRTLPSPSSTTSNNWDFSQHGFGEPSYGTSMARTHHHPPMDGHGRAPAQDPLLQWYEGNDGPWVPKGVTDIPHEERVQTRQTGNRSALSFGTQYRQPNPSDAGSAQYGGVPNSDSGYGTRRSVGNTSVYSADIPERDQDCQSLIGHIETYQPFYNYSEVLTPRPGRVTESWNSAASATAGPEIAQLVCPTCGKGVKTQSELKKHDLRHRKPFKCKFPDCPRTEGFSTTNDLDRHTRSKHPSVRDAGVAKMYRCPVPGCKSKDKAWPRLDNFRSHLRRVHHLYENGDSNSIRCAELQETSNMQIDSQVLFSKRSLFLEDSPKPDSPAASQVMADFRESSPYWRRENPTVIESLEDPLKSIQPQLAKLETKTIPQEGEAPLSQMLRPETVKPVEVFSAPPEGLESKFLERVLGRSSYSDTDVKGVDSPATNPSLNSSVEGKTAMHGVTTPSASNITGFVKTRASEAQDVSLLDPEETSLPTRKESSGSPSKAQIQALSAIVQAQTLNLVYTPSSGSDTDDSQISLKTEEMLLKKVRDLGYTIQKDPSASPKPQNLGSAVSNKSDKDGIICKVCEKSIRRPCELKKHMKRHERPYGCTFLACCKTFGSKNDWKRHENSQHSQAETWRCEEARALGGSCGKVCYRQQTFRDHLKKEHHISDDEVIKEKLENCHIGRNCESRFWCGFCTKLVELKMKNQKAWTERFDHIDDHFMGRNNLPKQSIQDWIPIDGSDNPRADSGNHLDTSRKGSQDSNSDQSGSGSPNASSPDDKATAPSPDAKNIDLDSAVSPKRKRSSDDLVGRSPKHAKTRPKIEKVIHCCRCHVAHNPKFNQSCTTCDDGHVFCEYCETTKKVFEGI